MKNIKCYQGDALSFHKKIVDDSLNKGKIKDNLIKKKLLISSKFVYYKKKFDNNNLFTISAHGFIGKDKKHLLSLYSSKRKPIIELKKELTTNELNQRINDCPNCTIEKVSSLDHYIPKDEFPEYSVNPLNLIPCCSTCNSKKKENWKGDENLLFLNLYSETIPIVQYLFVEIISKTEFTFQLKNTQNIDVNLFEIIESHYSKLDLLERFRENSDEVISELDILISSFKYSINDTIELQKFINNHYSKIEARDGINKWKVVLVKAMLNSNVYFN
ncbi:HNH endonuclease [Tenacibaculum finnmarkense]|uniref:HNH endonuclease n=1 Tax=Tenacibaculum finnmarkense TaxID=2781243 RepID=UPI00187B6647|nr:HNH endonuclease [Tenacibaculum finnmarkense]MBE7646698.1 HNH endonuclease [Tenacibaculum finnmarkense genomovar ulcerans]MCG8752627.1 HNH endonuclease [Tenacibaculum finnmarkense]MCG8771108.1 HNH endonuclease [Tenacibaculum finnmarkense]MCG8873194.1 HNH endonuclease [Tenacibaculum finnmarkense]